jgi:hypothetical protein
MEQCGWITTLGWEVRITSINALRRNIITLIAQIRRNIGNVISVRSRRFYVNVLRENKHENKNLQRLPRIFKKREPKRYDDGAEIKQGYGIILL